MKNKSVVTKQPKHYTFKKRNDFKKRKEGVFFIKSTGKYVVRVVSYGGHIKTIGKAMESIKEAVEFYNENRFIFREKNDLKVGF